MTPGTRRPIACENMNHRRRNAPVRHCPLCGEVVNEAVPAAQCDTAEHSAARRKQRRFCIDCGAQLIR